MLQHLAKHMTRTIHVVVGVRPNQMKAAPLLRALREHPEFTPVLVDNGQHYDHEMAGNFMKQFDMEDSEYSLKVGSGTYGVQPARILEMDANTGTVAIVSHNFDMLENLCERIVLLENGCIKDMGEPEHIIEVYHCGAEPSLNSSSEEKG